MPTKATWSQYLIDIDAWEKGELDAYVSTVKSLVLAHHNDTPSTEIGYPTGSVPSSPPPPPPGS